MVDGWLQCVQGVLFPPSCVLCGGFGQPPVFDLCAACAADLPRNHAACRRCAVPLSIAAGGEAICGDCLLHPRHFDRAIVPFRYAYPVDHLVRGFKYRGALAYGRVLATLLAQHLAIVADPRPQLLIPVPLHLARHRERGFNQSTELARRVGSLLDIRVDENASRRIRATEDQTQLSARARRKNVRRAFALAGTPGADHVAIVDDVLTTGSTVAEIARLLRRSGIGTIQVWAVARATALAASAQASKT